MSVAGLGQAPSAGTRLALQPGAITEDQIDRVEALIAWAAEHGVTILEVAVGGLAAQPGCTSVIAGAMSPEQVTANVQAAGWAPAGDELAGLDLVVPPPVRAH